MDEIFKGLRVIELAGILAGPAVGMFFAELGAEVIKVENRKTGGDPTRQWKLPGENLGASAYYHSVNWGKKAVLMDLTDAEERERVYQWVESADIVISNFKSASGRRLGMDEATLRRRNPRLIYAQLTAFGEEDPERAAFDIVLQAEAGFLYMTGEPGRPPVRMPVALIDLLAAHQLKEGILIALLKRARTGEGSLVETSLLESAVASLANQATNWLMAGHIPQRMGSRHPNIAPYGDVFYTADDKPVVLAAGTDKQFAVLCSCLGAEDLAGDASFITNAQRVQHRESLCRALTPYVRKFKRQELMERLVKAGVPAGSIRSLPEVFELPLAKQMVLRSRTESGQKTACVKTVAFHIV